MARGCITYHLGGSSASITMWAASGFMRWACSSSSVASSKWTGVRGRRKREELARESLKERKRRVRERVVGVGVDDEAIAVVTLNVDGIRLLPRRVAQLPDGPNGSWNGSSGRRGLNCYVSHWSALVSGWTLAWAAGGRHEWKTPGSIRALVKATDDEQATQKDTKSRWPSSVAFCMSAGGRHE